MPSGQRPAPDTMAGGLRTALALMTLTAVLVNAQYARDPDPGRPPWDGTAGALSLMPHLAASMNEQQRLAQACIDRWGVSTKDRLAVRGRSAMLHAVAGGMRSHCTNCSGPWLCALRMHVIELSELYSQLKVAAWRVEGATAGLCMQAVLATG
jgi:hypothetical protein